MASLTRSCRQERGHNAPGENDIHVSIWRFELSDRSSRSSTPCRTQMQHRTLEDRLRFCVASGNNPLVGSSDRTQMNRIARCPSKYCHTRCRTQHSSSSFLAPSCSSTNISTVHFCTVWSSHSQKQPMFRVWGLELTFVSGGGAHAWDGPRSSNLCLGFGVQD